MNDPHRSDTTAEVDDNTGEDSLDPNQLLLLFSPEDSQVPEQPNLPFQEQAVA